MWERILTEAFIVGLLAAAIRTSSPILLGALGEIYSERAGVLNIGLEAEIKNTLALDYPALELEVIVISDGATEDTAVRAKAFDEPNDLT